MKLIIAIVNSDDSSSVQAALTEEGYFVTKLSTTGGFLKKGNTTFFIGTNAYFFDLYESKYEKYFGEKYREFLFPKDCFNTF